MRKILNAIVIITILLLSANTNAQWPTTPPIYPNIDGGYHSMISDGNGGAFLITNPNNYHYSPNAVQGFDRFGNNLFQSESIYLNTELSFQLDGIFSVLDDNGGLFVLFLNRYIGTLEQTLIFHHFGSSGAKLLGETGKEFDLISELNESSIISVNSDGNGGMYAFLDWPVDIDGEVSSALRMFHLDSNNVFVGNDTSSVLPDFLQRNFQTSEGPDGLYFLYQEQTDSLSIDRGWRLNFMSRDDQFLWGTGIQVNMGDNPIGLKMVASDSGVTTTAINDFESGKQLIAQRFDSDGNALWGENGKVIETLSTSLNSIIEIASSDEHGSVIVWQSNPNESTKISAIKVDNSGQLIWNGVKTIFNNSNGEYFVNPNNAIAFDDELRIIFCYGQSLIVEDPNGNYGRDVVFVRKFNSFGNMAWNKQISEHTDGSGLSIVTDGHGGGIVAWSSLLTPSGGYCVQINAEGDLGDLTVSVDDDSPALQPKTHKLSQNYPNPFNPATSISFSLTQYSKVNLTIYSITGRKVATLVNKTRSPGEHAVQWNGTNFSGQPVSSGVYFYRLTSGNYSETKKMLLVK